ncbi:MAG: S-methyl-5-thioribose-1-phosphate isomerase [Planctomycetaceae bacterium]|nr:S-methyl-5-thioribose-1-phosphate isomerase [Planctomycetaceae bacterium]
MPSSWETLRWVGGLAGQLVLLDQTCLPGELREITCRDVSAVVEAIRALRVRGAPAIGIAAAYGLVLGLQPAAAAGTDALFAALEETRQLLSASRPTAVNLNWALERMGHRARQLRGVLEPPGILAALLAEAQAIHDEDRATCRAIGRHGAALLRDGMGILTHCNAGALAASEYGTALAVIYTAHEAGLRLHVFADETRPLLQGARLTAWELVERGVDTTLICDSMAAQVMREGRVQAVITGADRIAANGDAANKIGTYALAVLADAHQIPFYIAAPHSTFDLTLDCGAAIPIEQRDPREITHGFGRMTAPAGVQVYNPAFDVTPARLIRALITDRGLIAPVTAPRIAAVLQETAPAGGAQRPAGTGNSAAGE